MLIRAYRKDDFDTLWRIDQECFRPGIAYSRFELGVYLRNANAFTLVAEDKKKIVGFITCHRRAKLGHVITIDVREPARRFGTGTLLLTAGEDKLRDLGCRAVFLETAVDNVAALRFYEKHGYHILRTIPRYYLGEIDALTMTKKIGEDERAASSE